MRTRNVDFSPLYRSIVGFDRLADLMDSATKAESNGYPPYNILQTDENAYLIELAVAGFGEEELTVEIQENVLAVSGRLAEKEEVEGPRYLHRGIAERAFERRFHLADHVQVAGASLKNGLLSIALERVIPETAKPRRISISGGESEAKVIEGETA